MTSAILPERERAMLPYRANPMQSRMVLLPEPVSPKMPKMPNSMSLVKLILAGSEKELIPQNSR